MKFGTYNRDSYTGLDYADQRFYASSYGRFNTADPYSGSAAQRDPVSWNLYSYTGGDPVNRSDPRGTDWVYDGGRGCCSTLDPYGWCYTGQGSEDCSNVPPEVAAYLAVNPGQNVCNTAAGPPPGPVEQLAPSPPQPWCEVGLFFRKAFNKRLPWNHAYLQATCEYADGETSSETIQADPGPKPVVGTPPRAPGSWLGPPWLVGVVTGPYAGPGGSGALAPNNFQVGSWEAISYQTMLSIGTAVLNYDYNYVQPYTLFPYGSHTYNSNSFIYTLDLNFDLGFSAPPGNNPGWGNLIPGLTP